MPVSNSARTVALDHLPLGHPVEEHPTIGRMYIPQFGEVIHQLFGTDSEFLPVAFGTLQDQTRDYNVGVILWTYPWTLGGNARHTERQTFVGQQGVTPVVAVVGQEVNRLD